MNAVTWRYNSFSVHVVFHGTSSGDRPAIIMVHWTSGVFQRTPVLINSGVTESSYTHDGEGGVRSVITPSWYLFADRCTRIILLSAKLYHLRAPDSCTNRCANTISRGYSTHVWCKKHTPSFERESLKGLQDRMGLGGRMPAVRLDGKRYWGTSWFIQTT